MRKLGLFVMAATCLVLLAGCLDAEHRLRNIGGSGSDGSNLSKELPAQKEARK